MHKKLNVTSPVIVDSTTTSQNPNPIQTKQGKQTPITTKQSNLPPVQTKQGQMPPIQAKRGKPVQRKNSASQGNLPVQLRQNMESMSGVSLDDVKVHYNSDKPAQLQAEAYAQGNDIHLAQGKEKHLGHEAWHVVQQKQGRVQPTIQANNGVGINDNPALEKEADVMGDKAQALQLKPQQETIQAKSSGSVVQRVVSVGEEEHTSSSSKKAKDLIKSVVKNGKMKAEINDVKPAEMEKVLIKWIDAPKSSGVLKMPRGYSQNRTYNNAGQLIDALIGQIASRENLQQEKQLATQTKSNEELRSTLVGFAVSKLRSTLINEYKSLKNTDVKKGLEKTGRYNMSYAAPPYINYSLKQALDDINKYSLGKAAGILADVAYELRKTPLLSVDNEVNTKVTEEDARTNHWTVNEDDGWVREARENKARLSAGPSATTKLVLDLAYKTGANQKEMTAIAWGLFVFWNQGKHVRTKSGTHRFHEVFVVAKQYGVDYNGWDLPESVTEASGFFEQDPEKSKKMAASATGLERGGGLRKSLRRMSKRLSRKK